MQGQINVKAENVTLFLENCSISNLGKKVISSDYDLIIVLVENTQNFVSNTGTDAGNANAISGSGKITINGAGVLTISSTKSGIKADGAFYGLGGELYISAETGHGINADGCIMNGISITVSTAAKDGIDAETDDAVLAADPKFDSSRGFVYIGSITWNTLASGIFLLGDNLISLRINDGETLPITRIFHLSDYLYNVRLDDTLYFEAIRNNMNVTLELKLEIAHFSLI